MMVTSSPTRRTIFKRKCFLIVYVTHYYYYLQTCAIWGKAAGPAWRQAGRLPSLCHQSDLSALRISERILLSPCTQDTGVLQGPRRYAKFNFSNCWINHLLILLLAPLFRRCVQKTSPHNSGKWPFVISQGGLWCTKSESICAVLGRLVPLLLRGQSVRIVIPDDPRLTAGRLPCRKHQLLLSSRKTASLRLAATTTKDCCVTARLHLICMTLSRKRSFKVSPLFMS